MKNLKYILPFAVLLVSIVIAVVIVKSKKQIVPQAPEIVLQQLRVIKAKKETFQLTVNSQGTVRAKIESELVAQVSGVVMSTEPAFVAGGFFKKGDILVQLDSRDYENRLIQAKYQVAQAELALKMEEQQASIAKEEWGRMNQGEAPSLVSREPQLAESHALLQSAKAGEAQAQLDLERTEIRAPFSGRIRAKNVDIGRYVTPGMSLATIYSIDAAEVRLPIPDQDLAYVDVPFDARGQALTNGPKVVLSAKFAGKEHEWTGRITHTEGEIDSRSRMMYIVAQVKNPYSSNSEAPLTIGMFVNAEILGESVAGLVAVPRTALRNSDQILIVDEQNHLRFRNVTIYRSDQDVVYVESGIEAGEYICLSAPATAVDGMKVSPIEEPLSVNE
jgi:RND family efflux transporter MFP subunit